MSSFKDLVNKFDGILRQYNAKAYDSLLPALTDKETDDHLAAYSVDDKDVKCLYQWKAGIGNRDGWNMTEHGGLLTFDFVNRLRAKKFYYDPLLVPLIGDNGEDILLFNTNRGKHYGKVYLYSVPQLYIEHPVSYFDSLQTMVETFAAAYEQGAYQYDVGEDWLDIDDKKFSEIAAGYNKNSVFWTPHDEVMWKEWYEI